jgi:hypothetical protein
VIEALAGVIASAARPAATLVASDLLTEWRFDDGSGTQLTDYSGNGHHGTLGAGAAAPPWSGGGLTFATDDAVTLPSGASIYRVASGFTISLIVKINSAIDNPLYSDNTASGHEGLRLGVSNAGLCYFQVRNAAGTLMHENYTATGAFPTDGTPFMLTATYDGSAFKTWRDDEVSPRASKTQTLTAYATVFSCLACVAQNAAIRPPYASVTLAGCCAYLRGLTQPEIAQNYAYWKALVAPRGISLP